MTEEPDIFDTSTIADLSDAAIEAALRAQCFPKRHLEDVRRFPDYWTQTIIRARVIQRHYPERMEDPDLAAVREIVAGHFDAKGYSSSAGQIRNREWERTVEVTTALAAFKAGREAERAGK